MQLFKGNFSEAYNTVRQVGINAGKAYQDGVAQVDMKGKIVTKTAAASPSGIAGFDKKELSGLNGKEKSDSAARGITSGGPRVININGVKMQVAEHVVIQAAPGQDPKQIMENIEPHLDDYWLRLLNSGSNVQDR